MGSILDAASPVDGPQKIEKRLNKNSAYFLSTKSMSKYALLFKVHLSVFCYYTSHSYYVCPIDGVASTIIIIFYNMETLDHAISSCLAPFTLPPCAEKPSEYCDF